MKTKIILVFLTITSLVALSLGLLWSHKLSAEKDIAHFFSDEQDVYLFYRPSECTATDLNWEMNGVLLSDVFTQSLATGRWKSIIAQQFAPTSYTLVFEQGSSFRDTDLDSLCTQLGIATERKFLSIRDVNMQWTIREIGNYIVFSNVALPSNSHDKISGLLKKRDRNASFACIIDGELQEYYCFPNLSKSFVYNAMPDLQVGSIGSMDFGLYNVVPKTVPFFEYVDKDLLVTLQPDWQSSPLLEYVESGVVFSAFNTVNFYVLPIADLFSAKEILASIAGGDDEANTQIKELMQVVPGQKRTYALAIENNLILASSQGVLESISLSYQMQSGFNTTKVFDLMMRNSSARVHYRWYNRQQFLKPDALMRVPLQTSFGYSYFRNRDKTMRFVSIGGNEQGPTENSVSTPESKVLWNFSLKNIQSSFHLNANPVVGVFNPTDRVFSVVDGAGKILTSIALDENIKSIQALEKGFLLETFQKLYWVPEQHVQGQRDYSFKGQIQSTIATYIWNGEEFITFISEQRLHKLSLKTGKIETLDIPVSLSNQLPQLHAFNHQGKLHIGYFSNQNFHAVNTSTNRWIKEATRGLVLYSEKIDGKIHFIEEVQGKGSHRILFGGEQQILNAIQPNFVGMTKLNQESVWLFKHNRDLFVYRPKKIQGTLVSVSGVEISAFEPVFSGETFVGVLALDDVQNEVHFFKRQGDETELRSVQKFRGSKFIKFIGNKQFVTVVDGQLVGYGF